MIERCPIASPPVPAFVVRSASSSESSDHSRPGPGDLRQRLHERDERHRRRPLPGALVVRVEERRMVGVGAGRVDDAHRARSTLASCNAWLAAGTPAYTLTCCSTCASSASLTPVRGRRAEMQRELVAAERGEDRDRHHAAGLAVERGVGPEIAPHVLGDPLEERAIEVGGVRGRPLDVLARRAPRCGCARPRRSCPPGARTVTLRA